MAFATLAPASVFAAADCKNKPAINPALTSDAAAGARVDLTAQNVDSSAIFDWVQVSGQEGTLGAKNNEKNAYFIVPTVTDPAKASITIQVTVTACGTSQKATAVINARVVNQTNQAPTAVAKVSPGRVDESGTFTLDGRDSTDPELGALTYHWEQLDHLDDYPIAGLPASTALVENLAAPAHVPYPAGVAITFQLSVTDPGGKSGIDQQTLAVSWVNDPPVARAKVTVLDKDGNAIDFACPMPENAPATVDERADFVLDGSESTDDVGIAPSGTYLWRQSTGGPSIEGGLPDASTSSSIGLTAPSLTPSLGDTMEFTLTVTDDMGLAGAPSPRCTVKVLDVTPPVVECSPPPAGTWYAANVGVHCTASDNFSGLADAADADFTLNTVVGEGTETDQAVIASRQVCDARNNCSNVGPYTFKVDRKPPTDITFSSDITVGGPIYFGSVPPAPTCSATDGGSGFQSCEVTGWSTSVGDHTLVATARDNVGNESTATSSYTVRAWTLTGFFQPVDMNGVFNTVKGGSTVPLKFRVFAGTTALTSTSVINATLRYGQVACTPGAAAAPIEETAATGGTILRYDTVGGQFIYNWKTPAGTGCYQLRMETADGSSLSAYFQIK